VPVKRWLGAGEVVVPYINNTNNKNFTNNINEGGETPARVDQEKELIEKTPGSLEDVKIFFRNENFPEVEADKFFNHFQSNGWQIAGKTPMQDWKASARSWILKMPNYPARNGTSSQPDQSLNNVNYDEPL
jgi:acyl carrier protein phosphodiesterase